MHIIVIGAGAAGISAARHLVSRRPDLKVKILEAADRPGGRAWSVKPPALNGQAVDLGCGWFHGSRDNRWFALARELDIGTGHSTTRRWSGVIEESQPTYRLLSTFPGKSPMQDAGSLAQD